MAKEMRVIIDGDTIKIIVPRNILIKAATLGELELKIKDEHAFICAVWEELREPDQETGLTPVHEMFDKMFERVYENADESLKITEADF